MASFVNSEKRLIAALDRIDAALDSDTAISTPLPAGADTECKEDRKLHKLEMKNASFKQRLIEMGNDITRLARANDTLIRVNAELCEGKEVADNALRAELDALKAARAAEIHALDDIMKEIEILIAQAPRNTDAPYAEDVEPASGDVVSFGNDDES